LVGDLGRAHRSGGDLAALNGPGGKLGAADGPGGDVCGIHRACGDFRPGDRAIGHVAGHHGIADGGDALVGAEEL